MVKPKIADLFCGAGGAGMGLHRAGFEVVGFDINPQPRYPFEFHQADALEVDLSEFDVVWASPPCQDYSKAVAHLTPHHPKLIDPIYAKIKHMPFIIENVVGAPIPHQPTLFGDYGIMLCGTMFSMRIYRHRLFLTSSPMILEQQCAHKDYALNPYDSVGLEHIKTVCKPNGAVEKAWRDEMGLSWMQQRDEWREAIPPAYSEFLGKQLIRYV